MANLWQNTGAGDLDFSEAEVQIFGPQAGALAVMRDALRHQGFRKITANTNVKQFQENLSDAPADLVLVDIDHSPAEGCKLIRDIRFRRVGRDPFVSVLALSGGIEKKKAPLVLNTGTDDILLRPMSSDVIRSRLCRLVKARMPFVGNPNYIGPHRLGADRACKRNTPLLTAPNLLRQKAMRVGGEPLDVSSIERTFREISRQQVERMGMAVRTLALDLEKQLAQRGKTRGLLRLRRVDTQLSDLTRHLKTQAYDDLVQMLNMTKAAVRETLQGGELNAKRLEVLRLHGDSLLALLRSSGPTNGTLASGLNQAAATVGLRPGDPRAALAA